MSQVILKENIRKVGRIGEVVTVAAGYAFNFLIPQNKAVPATKDNIAALEIEKERLVKEDSAKKDFAQKLAATLPTSVFLAREINQNGALYGHISAKDILEQLPEIKDKHAVHFGKNINSYGVHEVEVELHHDVVLKLLVSLSDTAENAKKQLQEFQQPKKKEKKALEPQEALTQNNEQSLEAQEI